MSGHSTRCSLSAIGMWFCLALGSPVAGFSQTVDVIHSFPTPSGTLPLAHLVQASDGNFYGMTLEGGASNLGTVFRVSADGEFATLHGFNGPDGARPKPGLIQGADGNLYGLTGSGGADDKGVLFRMGLDGTFTVLHSFSGGDDGGYPGEGLVPASNGNFYGVTQVGGPIGTGTFFGITPDGDIAIAQPLQNPMTLSAANIDGLFFGTTAGQCFGSPPVFACSGGTIFSITTNGASNVVHQFDSSVGTPPDKPNSRVLQIDDGTLFGTALGCSAYICNEDWMYRVRPDGTDYAIVIRESASDLTQAADGELYWAHQSLMRMWPDGTGEESVHTFTDEEGILSANAVIQADDGNFYTSGRGIGPEYLGLLLRITTSGDVSVLHTLNYTSDSARPATSLIQATDGNLYGTSKAGGSTNLGTIFRATLNGSVATVAISPSPTTDAPPVQASDGHLYATGFDWIFSDTGYVYRSIATLSAVTKGGDGQLLVTTVNGGDLAWGSVFSIGLDGSNPTTVHSFNLADGQAPKSAPIKGSNGNFYGTTSSGGGAGAGVIYQMFSNGSTAVLHDFAGTDDGAHPVAPLTQASDGLLYGISGEAGTAGAGTLFKTTLSGSFNVVHTFDAGPGGKTPAGGVIQASDGNFYGVTSAGGTFGLGTIYRLTPSGGFTVLRSFDGSNGSAPAGGLIQASDGNLYGTTEFGGPPGNDGVMFRINLPPCQDTFDLHYSDTTLTMGFTVGASVPATFRTWLVTPTAIVPLWNAQIPAVIPKTSFNVPITGFPHVGNVGVLTLLNAPQWTSVCWDWHVVDTGGSGLSVSGITNRARMRGLLPR